MVIYDDMLASGDGRGQLIYSDMSIWKALLRVGAPATARARNTDTQYAPFQPKIVTCQDAHVDEFINQLDWKARTKDKEAFESRTAWLHIKDCLFAQGNTSSGSLPSAGVEPQERAAFNWSVSVKRR